MFHKMHPVIFLYIGSFLDLQLNAALIVLC